MNLDISYCRGETCAIKHTCKRCIENYELPDDVINIWMFKPEVQPCDQYWPTEDVSE